MRQGYRVDWIPGGKEGYIVKHYANIFGVMRDIYKEKADEKESGRVKFEGVRIWHPDVKGKICGRIERLTLDDFDD